MADETMKVGVELDVHTSGTELVENLRSQLAKLNSDIRNINTSMKAAARGLPQPGRATKPAKQPDADGGNAVRTARTKAKAGAEAVKTAQRINLFDREAVKLFRTKLNVQAKATADAMRAEKQAFQNFRTRNEAQARFESDQVRSLKDRMTAETRIARMRMTAEKSQAREQAKGIAEAARLENRRMREAAAAIRDNARIEAREARHIERDRSRHESARGRYVANLRSGGTDIREGAGRVVRGSAAVSAVGTGAAVYAARKGISSRLEVDSAETNLKIFSGQTNEQIKAARKGFLDNLSIKNGLGIAGGLDAYSEVLKTGMKEPAANVKTIMEAVSALELDLKNTTKLAGLIDRNYGASSDPAKIKSALNAVAVAAREDPTQSNEIVEGVKRAFGALSTGNMTPEQLTALVSGGQSVGIQPGKAGTYVATLGKQLSMGNSKFLGKKNRAELNFAAKELGFGDARRLASEYSSKSYDTMMAVQERLSKMEAGKRTQVAEALMGRQWSDEALQFSQGVGGVKKTYGEITDSKNARFLEEAARTRAESLQGQWNSTKSIIGRFWDAFGQGFEDILSSINRYFLELNSSFDYDRVKQYVVEFFDGVKEALGVKTWTDLLHNLFGGDIGNIGPSIKAFARGLTEGVLSIGRAIRGFASVFTGGDMSAETLGSLSGKFLGLSLALVALAPVLSVLGGLASVVMGLAVASKAIAGLAGLGSTVAAGAGAGIMKGLGLALSRLFALSVVAEIGANRGVISTWLLAAGKSILQAAVDGLKQAFSKESIQAAMKGIVSEFIPAPVQRWLDSDGKLEEKNGLGKKTIEGLRKGIPATPVAPAERGYLGKAWDWLSSSLVGSAAASEIVPPKGPNQVTTPTLDPRPAMESLKEAVNDNTLVHRQSYEKQTAFGGLIHKASISTTAPADTVRSSMSESASGIRNAVLSGSTGSGTMAGGFGPLGNSTPGTRMGGGGGLGYRGIIAGAMSGRGAGPGRGNVGGFGGAAAGPVRDRMKSVYDAFRSTGLSHEASKSFAAEIGRENDYNPNLMYGSHIDPYNGKRNAGMMSWQGDRATKLLDSLREGGHLNPDGSIKRTQEALNAQAAFAVKEMGDPRVLKNGQRALGVLNDPNATHAQRALALGDDVIKWRQHDPRYASHAFKRDGYYNQMEGVSKGTAAAAMGTPNADSLGIGKGQYEGLKVKGGQATGGGNAYAGVTDLARQVQDSIPGGVKHFSAFNDHFHKGRRSKHNEGLAFDTTLIDGSKSIEAAEAIRNKMRSAGLTEEDFKVIDEYRNPSGHSTGGHIHSQFNNAEAAKKYSDHVAALKKPAQDMASISEGLVRSSGWKMESLTERAESIRSSGWRPSKVNAPTLGDGPPGSAPTVKPSLGDSVPPRVSNTQAIGGGGGKGNGGGGASSSSSSVINVNGAGMSAEAVANAVQRRLNEGMNRRTHDIDPSFI